MEAYSFIFDVVIKYFTMPGVVMFIAGVLLCSLELLEHKIFKG